MHHIPSSFLQKLFWALVVCALMAGPAPAAIGTMSDEDFLELCQDGSAQQVVDAINSGANMNARYEDGIYTAYARVRDWATFYIGSICA